MNGEAIYGTRPYQIFGKGPFQLPKTGVACNDNLYHFTAQEIRFASKGDALYAIVLAVPTGEVRIKSLGAGGEKTTAVRLLGSTARLSWKQDADGLAIQAVKEWLCQHAVVFKMELKH